MSVGWMAAFAFFVGFISTRRVPNGDAALHRMPLQRGPLPNTLRCVQ